MKYAALLSIAPLAPPELLQMIAGALAEQPPPDLRLMISEALHEAATFQAEAVAKTAEQMRALAITIAAGAGLPSAAAAVARPVSLIEEMRATLWELLQRVPSKNFRRRAPEGRAWLRALAVTERANLELGPPRTW